MITRAVAIANLQKYLHRDLLVEARSLGIEPIVNGKLNKGWKGVVLERLAGLDNNNAQAPNGLGFELKSTAYYMVKGKWRPKETMAITMIKPEALVNTPFYESHCWDKLKSIVFCAVSWEGHFNTDVKLLKITSFDFLDNRTLLNEIEEDYEFIRAKCRDKGFNALTGKDGKWIQARTKGAGHGSTSRAFFAKKDLINEIMKF
jgi:DNA mismatch repair protein MutH